MHVSYHIRTGYKNLGVSQIETCSHITSMYDSDKQFVQAHVQPVLEVHILQLASVVNFMNIDRVLLWAPLSGRS